MGSCFSLHKEESKDIKENVPQGYEKLDSTGRFLHLFTDQIIQIPDEALKNYADRLHISLDDIKSMINNTGKDIVVDGCCNLYENFTIEYHFPIIPILYDQKWQDAIIFIGTHFYSINEKQEISQLRITQPSGIAEARIERFFTRKLDLGREVELKAWRSALIILPCNKREDVISSMNIDLEIGEGRYKPTEELYKWVRLESKKRKTVKHPATKNIKLSLNPFRGHTESYFQVKPFEYATKGVDKSDTLIIFNSRQPYEDWKYPDGEYMPTIPFSGFPQRRCPFHYGPCTVISLAMTSFGFVALANVCFLRSSALPHFWNAGFRFSDSRNEIDEFIFWSVFYAGEKDPYMMRKIQKQERIIEEDTTKLNTKFEQR